MLRPTKYSHPDQTVMAVISIVLKKIKKDSVVEYETLLDIVKQRVKSGEVLFLPALNVLFLLGTIEYYPKKDVIAYTGKK